MLGEFLIGFVQLIHVNNAPLHGSVGKRVGGFMEGGSTQKRGGDTEWNQDIWSRKYRGSLMDMFSSGEFFSFCKRKERS